VKVWIDADACPRPVKDVVFKASRSRQFDVTLVANRPMTVPRGSRVTAVQVAAGLDVADAWLVQHAEPGDLVITADIPLAAELVAKEVTAMNPRGETYTTANVGERLAMRDFFTEARESGLIQGSGPPPYDGKAKRSFANALDRWLTKALRLRDQADAIRG
jgi:uncharacterized protein YaiI (UPF0178 family)